MKTEEHTLVVPVDGSAHSGRAIDVAAELAHGFGARVQLLHVMPAGPAELSDIPANRSVTSDGDLAEKRAAAEQVLESARRQLAGKLPGDLDTRLLEDPEHQHDPASTIIQQVNAIPGAIVVMGSRGLGEVRKFLLGSIGDAVVHKAHHPVTLVHADQHPANTGGVEQVLVPVDGSEQSFQAARLAGRVARGRGVPVELLFCHEGDSTGSPAIFDQARAALGNVPAGIREQELSGPPATALLDHVNDQRKPSLLVMGRRGMSGWQEALLGSVSRTLLSKSVCPVMVTR